jgi:hypothetical protein
MIASPAPGESTSSPPRSPAQRRKDDGDDESDQIGEEEPPHGTDASSLSHEYPEGRWPDAAEFQPSADHWDCDVERALDDLMIEKPPPMRIVSRKEGFAVPRELSRGG